MDTKKLTIGQMAKLNHITKQTLRLYDKKGLLKPAYIDKNKDRKSTRLTPVTAQSRMPSSA